MGEMDAVDDIVALAVHSAARRLEYRPGARPEGRLVTATRTALAADPRVRLIDGTPVYKLPHWTRPPGGVDIVFELADGTGRAGCEMKVGKPDESIWDAIKLADVQAYEPRVRAGYLISDA